MCARAPVCACARVCVWQVRQQACARERFTAALRDANIRVSTATASYGLDPQRGDRQRWPVFPLTINPSLLRRDNAAIVAAFRAALGE